MNKNGIIFFLLLFYSAKIFASDSVLASGDFYKLSVTETGICKLDYNFFQSLGINTTVTCSHIRIYGNGGGMLPELVSAPRYFDLQENAIQVVDQNGNDIFENGDYVLFYAKGPTNWEYNASTQKYSPRVNLYDDKAYYFVNIDKGIGKRIQDANISGAANTYCTTFYHRDFFEEDKINPAHGGREFLGQSFKTDDHLYHGFPNPNYVPNENINIDFGYAAYSPTSITSFAFTINDSTITRNIGIVPPNDYHLDAIQSSTGYIFKNADNIFIDINVSMSGDASSDAWLDKIVINSKRNLVWTSQQMAYRNPSVVGTGNITEYTLSNANSSIKIWNVSNPIQVINMQGSLSGTALRYTDYSNSVQEYIAFDGSYFIPASAVGKIENQNLNAIGQPDYIIVTHPDFLIEAERLADFHRTHSGLDVQVVLVEKIYNQFSSGAQDITAIRNFMKMLWENAAGDMSLQPRYLLLFGDGSFDYKNLMGYASDLDKRNFVPTFESNETFNPYANYSTDDFFGTLSDGTGDMQNASDDIDVGVGRFNCRNTTEAKNLVDKVIRYSSDKNTVGNWRNKIVFLGDDEDANTHIAQNERIADSTNVKQSDYNLIKIYLDAYHQEVASGGNRYSEVNKAILDNLFQGCFILNYFGHGSEQRITHEAVFTREDINNLENRNKMPLVVTGTCEFSRWDDPEMYSAGEAFYMNPNGGAIAMFTTVRVVYSQDNFNLVNAFFENMFPVDGYTPRLGDIFKKGKNAVNTGAVNKRKFNLLGDPALQLSYPKYFVKTTSINNNTNFANDTISGLEEVTIKGEIVDAAGIKVDTYEGMLYPTIYDKPSIRKTLMNDNNTSEFSFDVQETKIFSGKATIIDGDFTFTCVIPKDIALNIDYGKISYYATDSITDAAGNLKNIKIGGVNENAPADNQGPDVQLYINDENFVRGGLTDENPLLIAKLFDENGINTAGGSIGHDITAVLDENTLNSYVLNNFYQAKEDDFKSGRVEFPFQDLADGTHTLTVKAWDTYNNSGIGTTEFVVASSASFALDQVLNFPNPFSGSTHFQFQHNMPGVPLQVAISIYSSNGAVVKIIETTLDSDGSVNRDIEWDGNDNMGHPVSAGMYLYKITVLPEGSNQKPKNLVSKLVVIR